MYLFLYLLCLSLNILEASARTTFMICQFFRVFIFIFLLFAFLVDMYEKNYVFIRSFFLFYSLRHYNFYVLYGIQLNINILSIHPAN